MSSGKQCILTITLPDGAKRSYATRPAFLRKTEAKAEAARVALEMGALSYFMKGATNSLGDQKPTTSDFTEGSSSGVELSTTINQGVRSSSGIDDIEKCCMQWRGGSVVPCWVVLTDPKLGGSE